MDRRTIIGLIFIILGCLILLDNLGFLEFPRELVNWRSIFLIIALANLINRNYRNAIVFFFIGGYFILNQYFYINIKDWWPLFLIGFGLLFFFRNKTKAKGTAVTNHFFDQLTIFGGVVKKITADELAGGKATTVFGGTNLDLSACRFKHNATFDIVTIFGGTELKLSPEVNAKVNVISILGGFDDKRKIVQHEKSPQIIIKGFTLFGGTELKD